MPKAWCMLRMGLDYSYSGNDEEARQTGRQAGMSIVIPSSWVECVGGMKLLLYVRYQ